MNLRFAEGPALPDFTEPGLLQALLAPTKEDVMRLAELGVLALLTLVVLLAVVRPLLRRVLAGDEPPEAAALAGPEGEAAAAAIAAAAGGTLALAADSPAARLMEFAKINGQVQAETVQRVVDMVRQSPGETAEVLRNWIHET